MANAIKQISVAARLRRHAYTLQCFGGAGGQHACLVADALGMTRVFVHPLAGVLSAYGMGLADQIAMREPAVELRARRRRRWPLRARRLDAARRRRRAPSCVEQGVARDAHRACAGACTCATRAPTPRWSCRSARPASMRARVRGRVPPALRLPDAGPARWWSRRCRSRRSAAGDAPRGRRRRAPRRAPRRMPTPVRRVRMYSGGRLARRRRCIVRERRCARRRHRRPGDHRRAERHHRRRAGLAGAS